MVALASGRRGSADDLLAPRRGRGRLGLAAGAALLALVLLAAGAAIGRATSPNDAPGSGAQDVVDAGPARVVNGVPVGYARTEAGAVSAAANYTAVLGGKENLDPSFGEETYPVLAEQEVVDELLVRSREFASTVNDPGALVSDPQLVLRAAPVGYRVDEYYDDEATVTVWAVVTGTGTQALPLTTAWGTERLTLRWIENDWRITAIDRESGPTPPEDGATAPANLAGRMTGFEPFVYRPSLAP